MINGSAAPNSGLRLRNDDRVHRVIYRAAFLLTCLARCWLSCTHSLATPLQMGESTSNRL